MVSLSDLDERQQKKFFGIVRNALCIGGIGLGLICVKFFFGDFNGEEGAETASIRFDQMGYPLAGYGAAILALTTINTEWVLRFNWILLYFILPTVLYMIMT